MGLDFETFFRLFNKTLDRHAPIKNQQVKKKKLSISPGLQKAQKDLLVSGTN